MNEEIFWKQLLQELEETKKAVFVEVIERKGSAPNAPGAKMYVTEAKAVGTVGGGLSEHRLISTARKMIDEEATKTEKILLVHDGSGGVYKSGMVCSGSQIFALIPLDSKDISTIKQIITSFENDEPRIMRIDTTGLQVGSYTSLPKKYAYTENADGTWFYQEIVGLRNKLIIIGGGHVSLALSRIMKFLDFHVTVLDNREDLETMKANTYANEKKVISYQEIERYVPEGQHVYVAIMSFAHKSDEFLLQKLVGRNYKYLGLMASKSKKKTLFSNLEAKGISRELLEKVHTPIGVSINSITPEEIAISIAAEIIAVKNAVAKY